MNRHELPFVKARFQNVYGPREILGVQVDGGGLLMFTRNVTLTFIWKSLQGEPLPFDTHMVMQVEILFLQKIWQRVLWHVHKKGNLEKPIILPSGVETSIKTLAEVINNETGNQAPLDLKPARDWDRSGKRFVHWKIKRKNLILLHRLRLKKG